jgi:hypothetical protein
VDSLNDEDRAWSLPSIDILARPEIDRQKYVERGKKFRIYRVEKIVLRNGFLQGEKVRHEFKCRRRYKV